MIVGQCVFAGDSYSIVCIPCVHDFFLRAPRFLLICKGNISHSNENSKLHTNQATTAAAEPTEKSWTSLIYGISFWAFIATFARIKFSFHSDELLNYIMCNNYKHTITCKPTFQVEADQVEDASKKKLLENVNSLEFKCQRNEAIRNVVKNKHISDRLSRTKFFPIIHICRNHIAREKKPHSQLQSIRMI